MDVVNILLLCLMSCFIGAVLMLIVQYYAFVRFFNLPETFDDTSDGVAGIGAAGFGGKSSLAGGATAAAATGERFNLPEAVLASLRTPDAEGKSSIVAVNLVLQFLFQELRHSNAVRKWFCRKLTVELDELIAKTTTGKLFDKLSIRDLDLGGQFPEIKNVKVHDAELHTTEGHLERVDLLLDLQYRGNFRLSIDADMVLGKKGFLSVKVRHCAGIVRLQFTRKPYTHWSLSFVGDPTVDLGIETQFQGRQMQSNVTSLISNQIRKAIRRKHTLPNYKLRYKPFFHKTYDNTTDIDSSDVIVDDAALEVTVCELSRLSLPAAAGIVQVFCTLTLAPMPWALASPCADSDRSIRIAVDLIVHKAKNHQIGIVFKQQEQQRVIVETVMPNTPAAKAHLLKGDVLVSIEGRPVTHIGHVAKIVKGLNRPMFSMRIERVVGGILRSDATDPDPELSEDFHQPASGTALSSVPASVALHELNISFSKRADAVQISGRAPNLRENSTERVPSSGDSSHANTPSNSPHKKAGAEDGVAGNKGGSSRHTVDTFHQHTTVDCDASDFIRVDDYCVLRLLDSTASPVSYLNIGVFGRSADGDTCHPLGYLNVQVANVLAECNESNLGQFIKRYSLSPPNAPNLSNHPMSTQSGFDPRLCFGDVLLSFVWSGNSGIAASTTGGRFSCTASPRGSTDRLEGEVAAAISRQHDFVRTHFHRATQCDFCGKKIWLKDAVQCRECAMCCHKKCVTRCQNSTVCEPATPCEASSAGGGGSGQVSAPEFRLTEAPPRADTDDAEEPDDVPGRHKLEAHRQSFSDLLAQGLKRVNSANNLAIPGLVASLGHSRSLPPSPQHSPRKQSLIQSTGPNPFAVVAHRLEQLPDSLAAVTADQIVSITEPLIGWDSPDEMMAFAKSASRLLCDELSTDDRLAKINMLLVKLRVALDSETNNHANLASNGFGDASAKKQLQVKDADEEQQRKSTLVTQSEERVQALSVVMLYLCSALQFAQANRGSDD